MKEHVPVGERSRIASDRALLRRTANLLAADLSLGELFERLTEMLPAYLDSSVVFIALKHKDDSGTIEFIYDHGEIRRYPHIVLTEASRALAVMRSGEMIWGNDPAVWAPGGSYPINHDRPWTNDTVSAIFVPMTAGGTTFGCLSVQSTRGDAYALDDVEIVAAIGHFLGVAVENQRMYQALQRTADFDSLTGLSNYAKLARSADEAIARATSASPAIVAVFNVVNFEAFNSLYGYGEGDQVLVRVASALRDFEDDSVTFGRFWGDTFIMLVTGADPEGAGDLVERIHRRLGELSYLAHRQTLPVSVAIGYAVAPLDGGNREDLVSLCIDRAKISRMQRCTPIGTDAPASNTLYGGFEGLEPIVAAILDGDPYTRAHLIEVNHMAKRWAEHNLALDRGAYSTFLQASLLHDAGKLLVADRILLKPGKLTGAEYEDVKRHAAYGRGILAAQPGYEIVAEIVGQHHERWDGRGYPNGLSGEQILPLARAIAILDVFSAMVSDRPYHRGVSEAAAIAELQRCAGTQFDPEFVGRFVAWRENAIVA